MKKLVMILCTTILCVFHVGVHAETSALKPMSRDFGLGVTSGNLISFGGTLKKFIGDNQALQFHLGSSPWWSSAQFSWLHSVVTLVEKEAGSLHIYAGGGATLLLAHQTRRYTAYGHLGSPFDWRVKTQSALWLGGQGNIGIAWAFQKWVPIDIFFELTPTVYVFPDLYFEVNAQSGARWYF
jgi:hypothetical protein